MKYCSKCGNELLDEAVICPKCGCSIDEKSSDKNTIRLIAKIFMLIGCISSAFLYLIPLAWTIPMTVIYWKKVKNGESVSTAFKVCSLIFVSLVAGILMLCDEEK